jgi:hypothetical protein
MSPRMPAVVAGLLLAAAPAFPQDWYEPNASLAADDAYARTSARSVRIARVGAPHAMRLDDAGRVLVAAGGEPPRVARLDADGRLDATFGDAGVAELPVWGGGKRFGLEVDAAGRIVVTGTFGEAAASPPVWTDAYTGRRYGAARLLADGSLDPAFSGDGLLELDAASGLHGLGAVRASGSDGAMLAVAEKAGPGHDTPVGPRHDMLVGLVRIAADGTLDTTYGDDGFATILRWPPPYSVQPVVGAVTDFAVDSAGRAVVAVYDASRFHFAVRLDAAGGFDAELGRASRVALDGAGRIVGLAGLDSVQLTRRLPAGGYDPTFSLDGTAWHQTAAGYAGRAVSARNAAELVNRLAALYATMSIDPGFEGEPLFGDREFLAVATRADRWALARRVTSYDAKDRATTGIRVQAIDPDDTGAIVSTTCRFPDARSHGVQGLAITPDGTAAHALADSFVLRVDLDARKPLPLPDLRMQWLGTVRARDFGGGRYRVSGRVRVRNVSARAASVVGFVAVGDGSVEVPLVPIGDFPTSGAPFVLRGRSSVVRRFTWEGTYGPADLAGARLSLRSWSDLPDADFADNTATSPPITPVYAPR